MNPQSSLKTRHRLARHAFTLIELMVVIAIIGMLVALLLPALGSVRDYARKAQCASNMKQIGLACQQYVDAAGVFPPGDLIMYAMSSSSIALLPPNTVLNENQRGWSKGSLLIHILPYVGHEQYYRAYDFRYNCNDSRQAINGKQLRYARIPVYQCPADNHNGYTNGPNYKAPTSVGYGAHNYVASAGFRNYGNSSGYNGWYPCNNPYAIATPTTSSPLWAPYQNTGAINRSGPFRREVGSNGQVQSYDAGANNCTDPSEVTDGLSKTIFIGENRPACSVHMMNGWGNADNGNGYMTTGVPINFDTCDQSVPQGDSSDCFRPGTYNTSFGFRSAHPGGANFIMGDGSVRFIPEGIDYTIYQLMGAKADDRSFPDID